jgi:hypothetical protein
LAAVVHAGHGDAVGDGADQVTEVAADAFVFVHDGEAASVDLLERDALVRAILAGDLISIVSNKSDSDIIWQNI